MQYFFTILKSYLPLINPITGTWLIHYFHWFFTSTGSIWKSKVYGCHLKTSKIIVSCFSVKTLMNCSNKCSGFSSTSTQYCVKSVRTRTYSGLHFPAFGLNTERYSVSLLYSARVREKTGQNNSEYGHFLRSTCSSPNASWIATHTSVCLDKYLNSSLGCSLNGVNKGYTL